MGRVGARGRLFQDDNGCRPRTVEATLSIWSWVGEYSCLGTMLRFSQLLCHQKCLREAQLSLQLGFVVHWHNNLLGNPVALTILQLQAPLMQPKELLKSSIPTEATPYLKTNLFNLWQWLNETQSGQCHWKKNLLLTFPERIGHTIPCHMGKYQVLVKRQKKEWRKSLAQNFVRVSMGMIRQDIVNSLGLASLNTVGGLWAIEVVSSHLILGIGLI